MRAHATLIFSGCLAIGFAGCASPYLATPHLTHGTTAQERSEALQFDPYPDPSLGPNIVGGRPRDFDIPRPPPPLAHSIPVADAPPYAGPPMVLSGPVQPYPYSAPAPAPAVTRYAAPPPSASLFPAPAVVAPPMVSPGAPVVAAPTVPSGPIYSSSPSPIATPTPGYDPYAQPH